MISVPDRRQTVELIDQACASGAARERACQEIGISLRTYQRWTRAGGIQADGWPTAERPAPANQLTQAEREAILEVCNRREHESLPPSRSCRVWPTRGNISPRNRASIGSCDKTAKSNAGVKRRRRERYRSPRNTKPLRRTVTVHTPLCRKREYWLRDRQSNGDGLTALALFAGLTQDLVGADS